ncbi:MAG: hypothetical protein J5563_01225 [Clostridia bacterium]|nr:hypothetical protein [Clostridia bacterium]
MVSIRLFDYTESGVPVYSYTMKNRKNESVEILNFGAIIRRISVLDKAGKLRDIVLGFDDVKSYIGSDTYFGAFIGRVANRISGCKFSLEGQIYTLYDNNNGVSLHGGKNGFDTLNVIDLSVKKLSPESAVSRGAVDILETTAKNAIVSTAKNAGYKCNFYDDSFYTSIIFNCAKIDINIRKGIMCLANWNGEAKDEFGGYYSAVYRPMSVRFGEYPENVTEPYYPFDSAKAGEYFAAAGCIKSDKSLTDSQGKALGYTVYCLSDGKDALSKVINSFVASLKSAGIELTVKCVSEEEYSSSLEKRSADIWSGPVYDSQSSDKYDYYHTGGKYNYSGVSDEMLDLELEELRVATDYSERCLKTALMLGNVMELAAELPLYQQKTIVVYNKSVIDENSIPLDSDPQGCRYIIRALQPAE